MVQLLKQIKFIKYAAQQQQQAADKLGMFSTTVMPKFLVWVNRAHFGVITC